MDHAYSTLSMGRLHRIAKSFYGMENVFIMVLKLFGMTLAIKNHLSKVTNQYFALLLTCPKNPKQEVYRLVSTVLS